MQNGIFFSVISFCYCIFTCILFFPKDKIKSKENKIYSILLVTNLIGLFVEIGPATLAIRGIIPTSHDVLILFLKMILVYLVVWTLIFTYYIIVVSRENKLSLFKKMGLMIGLISFLVILFLPLDYHIDNGAAFSFGASANYVYLITSFLITVCIYFVIKNIKKIGIKKYFPLIIFIILGIIVIIIQYIWPELTLMLSLHTFVICVMYHTIENPDMKMIEQLNIARDQADRANNAKSEFLSNMSHEIRTPLNAIVGFSQALKEENLPKEAMEEVEDIITASSSLLEIVNGILDISKIEAGKLEIVRTEYSFKKVYEELISLTHARIGDKPIELKLHYDETIPPVLYGDHTRVKQVILNLLTNAAKYTKEGYIEFKVSTVRKGNICRLIISVEDSGIGIKNENIAKLFSKFERFDIEKNITIEGTGLGLAITKKLMDLMKGKIVVQSVYGKGSKFTLAIDQKIVPKNALEEKNIENNNNISLKGKKVLLVDDNKLNLKVASRLIRPYGIIVEEVDSGFACIEKIKEGNHYDLILLDDMMPKMSGVETLGYLKSIENFSIKTVALTANAISGMREKYISVGFDDYLSKPIDKNELNNVLNKFLQE